MDRTIQRRSHFSMISPGKCYHFLTRFETSSRCCLPKVLQPTLINGSVSIPQWCSFTRPQSSPPPTFATTPSPRAFRLPPRRPSRIMSKPTQEGAVCKGSWGWVSGRGRWQVFMYWRCISWPAPWQSFGLILFLLLFSLTGKFGHNYLFLRWTKLHVHVHSQSDI